MLQRFVAKSTIYLKISPYTYEVPYAWLLLELEVRKACEDRGSCFIAYAKVLELCK